MATTASTNIYVSPLMPETDRVEYETFIDNTTIFVPDYVYEGGYDSPKLYLEYGIEQLTSTGDYESAVSQNYYDKTLYFGDLKSLPVYNNIDEYLYDLVYVELVDPLDGVKSEVEFQDITVYPNSLEHMRTRLETITVAPETLIQTNLDVPIYILNAKKAGIEPFNGVILCKAQPEKGRRIIARIKKQIKKKLFNFNQFNFTFDRFVVETTAVSTASTYLIFPKRTI